MRKTRFKSVRFFLKLLLFLQIYSHNKFEAAEAAENQFIPNDDGGGTGSKDKIFENEIGGEISERPKRPARLLPLKILLGKDKNKTAESENSQLANARFYGPATSCLELLKIGYTRNGFYLVKGNDTSNNNQVEVIDCLFKNPNGTKEINEKRLGFIPLKNAQKPRKRRSTEAIMFSRIEIDENHPERSKRPARLLPFHLFFGKKKNLTEEEDSSKPFFGPPTNCIELEKIGYTLNGYYLVKGSENSNQIEVVLCRFQLPLKNNENVKEERLGFVSLDQSRAIIGKLPGNENTLERKRRPVRLLPFRSKPQKGENENKIMIYNNPANCSDIGKLGYTLNGFYLVNGSEAARRFGVAFCQFQLPQGTDGTAKGETFGFFNLSGTIIKDTSTPSPHFEPELWKINRYANPEEAEKRHAEFRLAAKKYGLPQNEAIEW